MGHTTGRSRLRSALARPVLGAGPWLACDSGHSTAVTCSRLIVDRGEGPGQTVAHRRGPQPGSPAYPFRTLLDCAAPDLCLDALSVLIMAAISSYPRSTASVSGPVASRWG